MRKICFWSFFRQEKLFFFTNKEKQHSARKTKNTFVFLRLLFMKTLRKVGKKDAYNVHEPKKWILWLLLMRKNVYLLVHTLSWKKLLLNMRKVLCFPSLKSKKAHNSIHLLRKTYLRVCVLAHGIFFQESKFASQC